MQPLVAIPVPNTAVVPIPNSGEEGRKINATQDLQAEPLPSVLQEDD